MTGPLFSAAAFAALNAPFRALIDSFGPIC
jgi:hypothetical protein